MTTDSFASKAVKVTLIACGVLLLLVILAPYFIGTMGYRNGMMSQWQTDEDEISSGSFASVTSDGFGGSRDMMMDFTYSLETAAPATENTVGTEQRVIKSGSIEMTAEDVSDTVTDIGTIATTAGGFVQSSALSEDEQGQSSGYITVRVPSAVFETTMTDIKALGVHVDNESVSGEDVTAQYVDIEARLSAAQAQETQYLIILEDASTVGEVLAVQEHLAAVRSEIESLQGQLTYLADRTDLSTISVTISEETVVGIVGDTKFDPARDFAAAIDFVVTLGQQLVSAVIWIVIVGIAIGVPVGIIWLIVRFFMNRGSDARRRK